MTKYRVYVHIDCPPGARRPIHVFIDISKQLKIDTRNWLNTIRFFGNWKFISPPYDSKEECEKIASMFGEKLKNAYYIGQIRYAEWGCEEYEQIGNSYGKVIDIVKEYGIRINWKLMK